MKKFCALLLGIILGLCAISSFAYLTIAETSSDDVVFTVETVHSAPGTDISASFTVEGIYEAHGFRVFIKYDPALLTLNSDAPLTHGNVWDQITANGGMASADTTSVPGQVGFAVVMPDAGFSASGTVFTMNFHVSDAAAPGSEIPLEIIIKEFNNFPAGGVEMPIPYQTVDGAVIIDAPETPAPVYTVTFNPNGGTLIEGMTPPTQTPLAEGATFMLPEGKDVYTKRNYYFAGWTDGTTDANGKLIVFEVGTEYTMPNHDVTLSAKWNKIFKAVDMWLTAEISLGFYMDIPDWMQTDDMKMVFEFNDKDTTDFPATPSVTIPLSDAVRKPYGNTTCYVFYCPVFAKEMIDHVYGKLVNGDGSVVYANNVQRSVREYAEAWLNNNPDEPLKNLLIALLNYGAASQEQQGYKATGDKKDLANNILDSNVQTIPEWTFEGYGAPEPTGALPEGIILTKALMLISKTKLRFFFKGDITGMTFKINGKPVEPQPLNEKYYVESEGINADNLNQRVTLEVSKDNIVVYTLEYGAFDYAKTVYDFRDDPNFKDPLLLKVVQGLYEYHQKAVAYKQATNQ